MAQKLIPLEVNTWNITEARAGIIWGDDYLARCLLAQVKKGLKKKEKKKRKPSPKKDQLELLV